MSRKASFFKKYIVKVYLFLKDFKNICSFIAAVDFEIQ